LVRCHGFDARYDCGRQRNEPNGFPVGFDARLHPITKHDTGLDAGQREWLRKVKITVLSPHRDDAAFSVGLTIGIWLDRGHRVEVVNCFTKSEYSPFGDLSFVHANDLRTYVTALRHKEDLRWSRQYRRPVGLTDLNLRDAPQRLQCSVEEVCSTPVKTDDPAMARIRTALERRAADALVLPLAIGDHVDHVTARLAAQDGWPASLPVAFYEDLPYSARPGAAEGILDRASGVAAGLNPRFSSEAGDVTAAVARKRQLALCYDSQIDSEVTEQIACFCERYQGRERLWVNDAWRDAGLEVSG
jgi:LmbE family N-acetylglucosaminyl deacetylase